MRFFGWRSPSSEVCRHTRGGRSCRVTLDELIRHVAEALDRERVPFFLIGGLAVSTWVEPRATKDMDIVLKVRRKDATRVKKALVAAGTHATSLELRILMEKRFVRFKTGGPLLDVRVCVSPHDLKAYERAVAIDYESQKIKVATAEDLVLYIVNAECRRGLPTSRRNSRRASTNHGWRRTRTASSALLRRVRAM